MFGIINMSHVEGPETTYSSYLPEVQFVLVKAIPTSSFLYLKQTSKTSEYRHSNLKLNSPGPLQNLRERIIIRGAETSTVTIEWDPLQDNINRMVQNVTYIVEASAVGAVGGILSGTTKFNYTVLHNVEYTVRLGVRIQCSQVPESVLRFSVGELLDVLQYKS